ncbi:hypothetical protein [Longispora albida]|uniref:hypothetical protein n=1 Tax=Longispora albida TaxID=203523 RepID=UPI00037CEE09|nr:hypothetical protein [Longispora albida]
MRRFIAVFALVAMGMLAAGAGHGSGTSSANAGNDAGLIKAASGGSTDGDLHHVG